MAFLSSLLLFVLFIFRYVQAQTGCCSVWWYAPQGAIVTRVRAINRTIISQPRTHIFLQLESTLEISSVSMGPGVHFVWPGMEPRNGSFVFQNVIGDDQPKGSWVFAKWYGPYDTQGDYHEYRIVPGKVNLEHRQEQLTYYPLVTRGDILTTIFDLNLNNGEWNDPWYLTPGTKGAIAGEKLMVVA